MTTPWTTAIPAGFACALLALAPAGAEPLGGQSTRIAANPKLDLHEMVKAAEEEATTAVPFGPRIAAGQGAHPDNHTVVRVFDRFGTLEAQFLAYPSTVAGGVRIETGEVFPGGMHIVASPLSDASVRQIRIFHEDGRLAGAFEPDAGIAAPFATAVGRFHPDFPGEQIAVASASSAPGAQIVVYDAAGTEILRRDSPLAFSGSPSAVELATLPAAIADFVIVQHLDDNTGAILEPLRGAIRPLDQQNLAPGTRLFPSAHEGHWLVGGGSEPLRSTLRRFLPGGGVVDMDAGWRENNFYVVPVSTTPLGPDGLVYTWATNKQGWQISSPAAVPSFEPGKLIIRYADAQPFDPFVNSGPIALDADQFDEFAIRGQVIGTSLIQVPATLFYFTDEGLGQVRFTLPGLFGPSTVRVRIPGNTVPGSVPWEGTITRIRLDIPDGAAAFSTYANARAEIDWLAITADPDFTPPPSPTGLFEGHVKLARYRHLRTDAASDNYRPPVDFESMELETYVGPQFNAWLAGALADYSTGLPNAWNPTFTHRAFIGPFDDWKNAIDPDTGLPRYSALTRLDNIPETDDFGEVFDTMTYAPGIEQTEALITWPLRAFLRELAPRFRQDPSKTASVEPNHEFEINIEPDGSVGDYNPAMIEGFRDWLFLRWTTLARINEKFGTSFANRAAIDPPRNQGRGAWDAYSNNNAYFRAWVDYSRSIINWRIATGKREALLAGFPPQILATHQIPPTEAVPAVLPGRRITPIDWSLTSGAGFGATRFGAWYTQNPNWFRNATNMGHSMVVMGEYQALTTNQSVADAQLRHLFDNGGHVIHHLTWANEPFNLTAEQALLALDADHGPRPGTTGGIGQVRPVAFEHDGAPVRSNIVQIGDGASTTGLLKGLRADGRWDGMAYIVPFHQRVLLDAIEDGGSRTLAGTQYLTPLVEGLFSGDLIEVSFRARTNDPDGRLTILATHDGIEHQRTRTVYEIGSEWRSFRWEFSFGERMEPVRIIMNSGERDTPSGNQQSIQLEDFSIIVHRRAASRAEYGIFEGQPHRGGVRFDILSREQKLRDGRVSPFPAPTPNAWRLE